VCSKGGEKVGEVRAVGGHAGGGFGGGFGEEVEKWQRSKMAACSEDFNSHRM